MAHEVPEVSRFFGISIMMFYKDHPPPHFHVRYASHRAIITIEDLGLLKGSLPPRVLGLVIEWALAHRDELRENWRRTERLAPLERIKPLE